MAETKGKNGHHTRSSALCKDDNRKKSSDTPTKRDTASRPTENMNRDNKSQPGNASTNPACEQLSDPANDLEDTAWSPLPPLGEYRKNSSLFVPESSNGRPKIIVHPVETPETPPTETNLEPRKLIFQLGEPSNSRTPDKNYDKNLNNLKLRNNSTAIDVPAQTTPSRNVISGSRSDMKGAPASILHRNTSQLRPAALGTAKSPIEVSPDDTESNKEDQNADERGEDGNEVNSPEQGDTNSGDDVGDAIYGLDDHFQPETDVEVQLDKTGDDGDARTMLEHIIELAHDPRQWAHFIGRDYKITRGAAPAKRDGHSNAGSLLYYIFHKINDHPGRSYKRLAIDHENTRVTLNAPGASAELPSPAIFKPYSDLSRIFDDMSTMNFSDTAKALHLLCKDIARNAKYLFLNREAARCFITEPELDWSFVVLLVITVLPQPELFDALREFGFSNKKHFRIHKDQICDLLKYLCSNSPRGYYEDWTPSKVFCVWERLQVMLRKEYSNADYSLGHTHGGSGPADGGEGPSQAVEAPALPFSKRGGKRKVGMDHAEPEEETLRKKLKERKA
ncbi:hypothetical protein DE146DRAFT_226713 [Phaeosphaeria sp. MPI-PUGE-AT-0046c]|nr:hypothetical protein DE146DRAFT_226713 [Phaeosphaeria sp. MPI-PUGE-AT-0046c]